MIDHVAVDKVYCGHPTPARYGFQSYISTPIILPSGQFFGTLCAIDPRPARVNRPEVIGMFKLFAELIAFHLDANHQLAASRAVLLDERHTSELREQFIAVLGHDLRNPLASIDAGVKMIAKTQLDPRATSVVGLIQGSVARMSALIDDVLDFARGRLGGGLAMRREVTFLTPVLSQVVEELRARWPERDIETELALPAPVDCDPARVAQLLSNLLANALTHGAADSPVIVRAFETQDAFELSVSNSGKPVPSAALERLFQPFERGAVSPSQQGLGLGLYIASEVARAHNGTLTASSSHEETRFTFHMPRVVRSPASSSPPE